MSHDLAPLLALAGRGGAQTQFRGLLHRLTEALGLISGDEGDTLSPQARAALKAIGVKAGRFGLYLPALLKPRAAAMRARLWGVQHTVAVPGLPPPDVISVPLQPDWPAGFADAMGWLEAGPVLLRLDIAERVAAELAWATRRGATAMPAGLASRFSLKSDLLPVVLRSVSVSGSCRRRSWRRMHSVLRRLPCCCRCGGVGRSQGMASPVHAHGLAVLAALKP